ncbi:DNA internalization-related competence protein ComEC/Rec2 [Halomonas sp. McH1-25]|uniref:DNA internalization-related competence protein ComEC/Rec2 n=3 Tax=Halomonas TaxID=2745 RepID=UPI001EF7454B|nr:MULTISPECIES: DNA internalization-related competence protein ComEC/Rec2 [unclassified Halomonas]MCG7599046.1 DNA internalization-related competence protein ComEC/Rec2 [Halomonas sp. McH1-25]MCP1344367.1 DNA internalization-related competence protein ComEC/Rec2 [Halomonas sp. FL8]
MGVAAPLAVAALLGACLGAWTLAGAFGAVAIALLICLAASRYLAVALIVVAAFCAGQVLMARGAALPAGLASADLAVTGRILSLSDEGRFVRVRVAVASCRPLEAGRLPCERLRHVRVSWYDAPSLAVGERWSLTLRMRPPAGFANPDTFDYGAWLWREGIDATGYVRNAPPPQRLVDASPGLRERALEFLEAHTQEGVARRWLAALTLGAGERLEDSDWTLLNASGTTHLMVISGLHVGLAATFVLFLARGLARLTMPRRWRMATWPWWSAAGAAAGYAWLAGLEPPAMRAMIMTLVGLWVASGRHAPGPWQGWWLALAIVLLVDPLALWRPGLWLSFIAVGLLILAWQGRSRPRGAGGWLWALLRTQCLLAPLMAAAVLVAFDRLAPVAPLINLVAVPLVGSVMVPLGLTGWLLAWWPPLAEICWTLFGWLAQGVHTMLSVAVDVAPLWQPAAWQTLPLALVLASLTLLWALPGLSVAPRWVGSALLALLGVVLVPPSLPEGTLNVRLYDVGQGQLIELQTAHHRLLYDTGPRFGSGFMPLTTLWPAGQRFDGVIVSHADMDHAGGIAALRQDHVVARWWSPGVESLKVPVTPCRAGQRWQWDGVEFRFLWPRTNPATLADNDRSCVLLVSAGEQRLMITGDAGAEVEAALLARLGSEVDVLVAGHHGSRTSSSPAWVSATRPATVLFSAGRGNPHGHPHDEVVRRFRRAGSCMWNTAYDGALTFTLGGSHGIEVVPQRTLSDLGSGVGRACHAIESPP